MSDPGAQLEKIFQQPYTGQTVNCRNVERGPTGPLVAEIEYLALQNRVIQEGPPGTPGYGFDPETRMAIQLVKLGKTALVKQVVDSQAAVTTKHLLLRFETPVWTRQATMKTRRGVRRVTYFG